MIADRSHTTQDFLTEEIENAIYSYCALNGSWNSLYWTVDELLENKILHQKLLEYARVAIQELEATHRIKKLPRHSLEMRLQLENCLHRGIDASLREMVESGRATQN